MDQGKKGFSTLHSGGPVTEGLNRRCTVPHQAPTEGLLWVARLGPCDAERQGDTGHTHTHRVAGLEGRAAETHRQARGSI